MQCLAVLPSDFWGVVSARSAAAARSGQLCPIATEVHTLAAGQARFVVRRALEPRLLPGPAAAGERSDPFAPPYEEDLVLGAWSRAHVWLLNKYPVLPHHLLIVTRRWESQQEPLTRDDFGALLPCLAAGDALGFYNGGRGAGASQGHKHLQVVPLPLAPGLSNLPLEALLAGGAQLPFPFRSLRLETGLADSELLERVHSLYRRALAELDALESRSAYNLVMTRDWLLLVPRRTPSYDGISVNALGYAGSFLVRSCEQLETVRRAGALRILATVAARPAPVA